jgi:hypothetical protein
VSTSPTSSAVRALRFVALALGAVLAAFFVFCVVARLVYPIEAEWMTGSVRDAVARVRDGKPLYGPPSVEFIPFLYTPLYYWTAGKLAHVTGVFAACKIVSLGATFGAMWAIARIAKIFEAPRLWTALAVLLHVSAFSFTLLFYDLERVDGLEATLALVALAVVLGGAGTLRTAGAGVLFALACFAKQPGFFALASVVVGLAVTGDRKRAAALLGAALVALVILFGIAHVTTGGWFWFYCFELPRAHGLEPKVLSTFFVVDMPRAFLLSAASIALATRGAHAVLKRRKLDGRDIVFASVVGGTMVSAFFLRAHRGGYPNVLMAWTPFACAAVAVAAKRAQAVAEETRAAPLVEGVLLAAVSMQFLAFVFDPNDLSPKAVDVKAEEDLKTYVHKLEEQGEVLVTTTGHITKQMHFHSASLYDIVDAKQPPPEDYVRALEARRFVAILLAAPDDPPCRTPQCREMRDAIERSYFVASFVLYSPGRMGGKVGFDGRPRWVLRPRKNPLPTTISSDALTKLRDTEAALAAEHGMRAGEDVFAMPDDTIEERGAAIVKP